MSGLDSEQSDTMIHDQQATRQQCHHPAQGQIRGIRTSTIACSTSEERASVFASAVFVLLGLFLLRLSLTKLLCSGHIWYNGIDGY